VVGIKSIMDFFNFSFFNRFHSWNYSSIYKMTYTKEELLKLKKLKKGCRKHMEYFNINCGDNNQFCVICGGKIAKIEDEEYLRR